MNRLSLQILNSNRVGELDILLSSLLSQTYQAWDLILLDESKTPVMNHKHIKDLITRMKCDGHGVIYQHQDAIYNIGKNRNRCFKIDTFKNELCVRIDDDSYCDKYYLENLVNSYFQAVSEDYKVGAIGGIVPVLGAPQIYKELPKIFNRILFSEQGDILSMADDGGNSYNSNEGDNLILSHHLRSSFLFTREAYLAVKGHPLEYGFNGFREETDFSIKMAFAGYKLFTNVNAICWHSQAGGGSRQFSPQEYQNLVRLNDLHFRTKVKHWYQNKGGNPYVNK